jgi:hypothetical protein
VAFVGSGQAMRTFATAVPGTAPGAFTQYHGLRVNGVAGSSVSDLTVTLPNPPDASSNQLYRGIFTMAPDVSIERVTVTTGGSATDAFGIIVPKGGTVSEATVSMPSSNSGTIGITNFGNSASDLVVERSAIAATKPVTYANELSGELDLSTSTILPESFSYGVEVQSGNARISSSLIDLGSSTNTVGIGAENLNNNNDPINADADHVTIVGGGANTIGIRAQGNSTAAGENSTLDLTNSVISGPAKTLFVGADNGETATITTNYSNYVPPAGADVDSDLDNAGATGTATLTESNRTNLAPGFVNPGAGNYHLAPGSQLIDIGDPLAPPVGSLDIDGDPRALSMTATCAGVVPGRRDIGMDEFVAGPISGCPPPGGSTAPVLKRAKKCKKRKPGKRAVSTAKRKCKRNKPGR